MKWRLFILSKRKYALMISVLLGLLVIYLSFSIVSGVHAQSSNDKPVEWDILDENMNDYQQNWNISKGSNTSHETGGIIQNDENVTIIETLKASNYAWRFLTHNQFSEPDGSFTYEVRAKINEESSGNLIGVRVNNRLIAIHLELDQDGKGSIRDRNVTPQQTKAVDVKEYNVYRLVVTEGYHYDAYVNGQYLMSSQAENESGGHLIKLGAESNSSVDMTIDYVRMANGSFIPEGSSADTTDLERKIAEIESFLNDISIGEKIGDYSQSSVDLLNDQLTKAKEVVINDGSSQSEINEMLQAVHKAHRDFRNSVHAEQPNFPIFEYQDIVIDPENMDYNPTDEYDFPSVIKATDYFDDPLATYYMYYGPHDAPGGIAMAYADSPEGPWTEYQNNPIISRNNPPHYEVSHVASAHPIWNEDEQKLFLYFHGENHQTRLASSDDGIHFDYEQEVVNTSSFNDISEASYARVFEYTIPSKGNKYTMLLMGNNNGSRKIYLAWSNDGRNWETERDPIISPVSNEKINHRGDLSGAYYFPWEGRHYVTVHAGSGNQYLVEVGEEFDLEIHHGAFNQAPNESPFNGRIASRSFLQENDSVYMFYEVGQRGTTKIALAKSVPEEELDRLDYLNINVSHTTLQKGTQADVVLELFKKNGQPVNMEEATINYYSSDPEIASFSEGIIDARLPGLTEVWAEVTVGNETLESKKIVIDVRNEMVWNIIDESFYQYAQNWKVAKGANATGDILQGDHIVTINEEAESSGGYHYLTNDQFNISEGEFTFEFRAKVNDISNGNEISVRVNEQLVSLFLSYDGEKGSVQNKRSHATEFLEMDVTSFHTYRVTVKDNSGFDLYVNGDYAWSGEAENQTEANLIKIGADSPATANMDIDYFKLNTGLLFPEEPQVNKEALEEEISKAEALTGEDYTEESWEAYQSKLDEAKEVLANEEATQAQVDKVEKNLETARSHLVNRPEKPGTNKEALAKEVAKSGDLTGTDYTEASWEKYVEALVEAISVLANLEVTQDEVDNAQQKLAEARQGLEERQTSPEPIPTVNKKALADEVAKAGGLTATDYTEVSWNAYESALAKAISILTNAEVTQAEVDKTEAALAEARENLNQRSKEPTANKDSLKKEVNNADQLLKENYTQASWEAYQEALKEAQKALANPEATQEEVSVALAKLLETHGNLKPVERSGHDLPNTATHQYHWLLTGSLLIILGSSIWWFRRKGRHL